MPAESDGVAVVGATGVVGLETLATLAALGVPATRVRAFASSRSSDTRVPYGPAELAVESFRPDALSSGGVAFLAAGSDLARQHARDIAATGTFVVDNSSAFRADLDVPLIVPEVNGALLDASETRLVANPNCSTILLLVALEPLRAFGIERTIVSTYQAVSGAGRSAMDELVAQTRSFLDGEDGACEVFPERCAFNVFPHESPVDPASGENLEEQKLVREARRIWDDPAARIIPTCVRVPVLRCHSESVTVDLREHVRPDAVRDALSGAAGVRLADDPEHHVYPTPLRAEGTDEVWVGRVRCIANDSGTTCSLWLCGDQLRKGAALNSVQIARRTGRL